MIQELKDDKLMRKVGGAFKLTALVQRRIKELVEGARPLIEAGNLSPFEIAIKEIDEDKIGIDYERTVGIKRPLSPDRYE
ncbi:MAG: DNA-directed RNA polymerase subunit omega [Phycisphaerae bacterium]|nr:DNA-directed RNA polymerase subunit omega [Phycisphaerae bacterium]